MKTFHYYKKTALLFICPQLIVTFIFFIWPALNAIFQSFFYSDAFGVQSSFAGLSNFIDLFYSSEYAHAILVTLVIATSVTILTMGLGLWMAVLVHGRKKGQSLYKSLLIWPYAVAPAVAAVLWRFLFDPNIGWLTHVLQQVGIEFNDVTHPRQALLVIIITASWQQFSYNFLFYYAALNRIPNPILEAATLDGASPWRRFWQIIFPLLSPTTFFLVVMNVIYSFFDTFGIIDIISHGGPEYSTTSLMYKVYEDGFVGMDPGGSSAQSLILMLLVTALTFIQFRFLDKKVYYR
jgi:sn-glycerol 3-phosphate transport system permease protein